MPAHCALSHDQKVENISFFWQHLISLQNIIPCHTIKLSYLTQRRRNVLGRSALVRILELWVLTAVDCSEITGADSNVQKLRVLSSPIFKLRGTKHP